jgi:uncharacterized protein (TIGR02186 family)
MGALRRNIAASLALGVVLAPAPAVAAPSALAAGLAEETLEVKVNYSGSRIVMFAASELTDDPRTTFGFALIGPSGPQTISRAAGRRRERFTFAAVPRVFASGLESGDDAVLSDAMLEAAGLDPASAVRPPPGTPDGAALERWKDALVTLKTQASLYSTDGIEIDRLEGGLTRARISLPPNAPPGVYTVRAAAFRDGVIVGRTDQTVTLVRGGMDATLHTLATRHGLIYGLLAIAVAVVVGGVAAWLGRR